MGLIPTYCDACERSCLRDEAAVGTGTFNCPLCSGQARSVPGSRYAEADSALYARLASMAHEAGISVGNAAQLHARLDSAGESPAERLSSLARTLPSFAELEELARLDEASVRKAEGMLRTILGAIASQRRRSGTMPALLGVTLSRRRSSKR